MHPPIELEDGRHTATAPKPATRDFGTATTAYLYAWGEVTRPALDGDFETGIVLTLAKRHSFVQWTGTGGERDAFRDRDSARGSCTWGWADGLGRLSREARFRARDLILSYLITDLVNRGRNQNLSRTLSTKPPIM